MSSGYGVPTSRMMLEPSATASVFWKLLINSSMTRGIKKEFSSVSTSVST